MKIVGLPYHCFLISTRYRNARNDFCNFTNLDVLFADSMYRYVASNTGYYLDNSVHYNSGDTALNMSLFFEPTVLLLEA